MAVSAHLERWALDLNEIVLQNNCASYRDTHQNC
jgi:hypothetical protein